MEKNINNLWEEKNSIEQLKKSENNQISDQSDIIKEIKTNLESHECNDIWKTSGIYKIVNTVNNKYYIGSTRNFKDRWRRHLNALQNNRHINKHLQNAWNKYGSDKFQFKIIENNIDHTKLLTLEQSYLNNTKIDECYNHSLCAVCPNKGKFGKDHPLYGIPLNEATKLKLSKAHTGRQKSVEHRLNIAKAQLGTHRSAITKLKISKALKGRLVGSKSSSYDHTIYTFKNNKLGITEKCTRYELYHKYKLNRGNLYSLIRGDVKYKSVGGWIVV